MKSTALNLKILLFARVCVLVAQSEISLLGCFESVTYEYSNSKVTGKRMPSFTYWDDHLINITLYLTCNNTTNGTEVIHIKAVNLILPTNEEEFCLDASSKSSGGCPTGSQCTCCQMPKRRCKVSYHGNVSVCNGKTECLLNISSMFLYTCSTHDFECRHKSCHSRWAQVIYTCEAVDTEHSSFDMRLVIICESIV